MKLVDKIKALLKRKPKVVEEKPPNFGEQLAAAASGKKPRVVKPKRKPKIKPKIKRKERR